MEDPQGPQRGRMSDLAAASACCLLVALVPATAAAQSAGGAENAEVVTASYTASDGSRVLRQSVTVPASGDSVWRALTTSEGLRSWAVPVARIDLRLGGVWESSYDPGAEIGDPDNIKNRILAYLPGRMLAIQAVEAPPGFPHPELLPHLFSVIQLEASGEGSTRVTVSGVGYREGPGYDELYRHFQEGNAWTLRMLRKRFESGPVDWDAVLQRQQEP